jgi:hypothetical protein
MKRLVGAASRPAKSAAGRSCFFEDARRWLDTLPTHEEALDAADTRRRAASGSRRGRGYDRPSGGNWQNAMGATLPALSRKRKKNLEKEKRRSKNKKETAEKKPAAGNTALITWTDRPPTAVGRILRYPIHRHRFGPSSRIRPPRIGLMPTGLLRATVARIDVAVA